MLLNASISLGSYIYYQQNSRNPTNVGHLRRGGHRETVERPRLLKPKYGALDRRREGVKSRSQNRIHKNTGTLHSMKKANPTGPGGASKKKEGSYISIQKPPDNGVSISGTGKAMR